MIGYPLARQQRAEKANHKMKKKISKYTREASAPFQSPQQGMGEGKLRPSMHFGNYELRIAGVSLMGKKKSCSETR